MAMDFSVVVRVRQHFGSDPDAFEDTAEGEAPFVGAAKDFEFTCPDLDSGESGVLLFQSFGVSHRRNGLEVNGETVFGGIPASNELVVLGAPELTTPEVQFELPRWNSHVLLLGSGVLQDSNVLRVESRDPEGGSDGELDEFIVDNMVVLFRTASSGPVAGGGQVASEG